MGWADSMEHLRLAARQRGVLSSAQARLSLTRRQLGHRVACRLLVPMLPGVFRVEGAPQDWRQHLKAIGLWLGHGYALSHRTAAALHGFARYPDGPLEASVTRNVWPQPAITLHEVRELSHRDLASVDGLRVTSATRTLLDLAAVDPEADVRAAFDEALRRRWTTLDRLAAAVERSGGNRGVRLLRRLVHEALGGDGPSESELEHRVLELLAAHELPRPSRQQVVRAGGRVRRIDFCFPGTSVLLEADGYAWHSDLRSFEKDRQRHNALQARGFFIVRWTWRALADRPDELVAQLRRMLALRAA